MKNEARYMTMKRMIAAILMICLLAVSLSACAGNTDAETADLVVFGTIYTAEDENDGLAEAFAVKDGKYIYVGDKEGAERYIQEGKTEVIDRGGEDLIIPGCTEGHSHYFDGIGLSSQLPGSGESYKEILKTLEEQVNTNSIEQFVSFGWNPYELAEMRADGFNFAEEIESIAPGIPVVLIDGAGHGAVCNTTALKNAGILDNPKVRGGEVGLDKDGKPSGFVSDQAVFYVIDKVISKPLTDEQYKNACIYGMNKLLELGYTNALDAVTNMYHPTGLYEAIKKMDDAGELKINIAGCYNIKSYDADIYQTRVDEVADIVDKYSSTHFDPAYIKLFADGVVESGTGWIIDEYNYAEEGNEHGNIIWNQDEMNGIIQYANSKDIIIHTHAYGDAAVKSALDAYIASNKANGKEYRNCLAHVRNIQQADIIRAAENKIPIAENLIWHTDYCDSDPEQLQIKQYILSYVPEDLYYSGYPMKTLLENGIIMSSSTDAPAAEYVEGSIMNVLEVAVTGIIPGDDAQSFAVNELLTVREGLKALTINGAWQLGLEKERGSIKTGKYADFVILDKNILDYQGEELRTVGKTKILSTFFEGEKVYSAGTAEPPSVKCYNGTFVGSEENGVLSFKGIPFAKAPIGELRWKAPQRVEASNETFDATNYGKIAYQPYASSEPVSWDPENMSEDCLTLNIWTTGDTDKKKPVMFWIHGGAYSYESAVDTLYSGQYMVEEHPDIVVVNANYRLGPLGFIDFSGVEGGEKFPTSGYNGLLDQIEALKWVQQNIEGFGGDPDNVTIFGESAGAGSVCALLAAEGTEGLFRHAIVQSGGLNFTYTHENFARYDAADLLLKKANAACVDDLLTLSGKEFFEIYTDESDGESLSYFFYAPLRGEDSIIPEDPYQAILDGAGKDVDLIIGTTADEYNYFIYDLLNPSVEEEGHALSEETKNAFSEWMLDGSVDRLIGKCTDEEKENIREFMALHSDEDEFWQKLDLMTEVSFRAPAIKLAENHIKAGGTGKTYMYYFAKKNTYYDWIGASHGCELTYVFHNFEKEQEAVSGPVLPGLADQVCGAWTSFAQFADPDYNGVEWPEYSLEKRETMIFNDDGTTNIENDPLPNQRELIVPLIYHYIGL